MVVLCAADLIEKICKPPPLCRPVVSPDFAPLECIQLMKQCWSEQPERRPSFDEIFDQVTLREYRLVGLLVQIVELLQDQKLSGVVLLCSLSSPLSLRTSTKG